MSHYVNVALFGFKSGNYIYYWKKRSLFRVNKDYSIKKMSFSSCGGSYRYKIGQIRYDSALLSSLSYYVIVKRFTPF